MSKHSALRYLRIAVTTALLLYVFYKSGLLTAQGWKTLFATFAHAKLPFVLAALAIVPLLDLASAIKWYCLARAHKFSVRLGQLYVYYVVGKFFNLIFPSNFGGDVVRIQQLGRPTGRYAEATAVIFVERCSGLVMLVVLTLLAVLINLPRFHLPWLSIALGIGCLGLSLLCWCILDERCIHFVQRFLSTRSPMGQTLLGNLQKFRLAVLLYQQAPEALWLALANSLLFYFLAVLNVWVSALAFGADLSLTSMLLAVPVMIFIQNLPFSMGDIGLMEFAYVLILSSFGVSTTVAMSLALFMRAKKLVNASFGGLLYFYMCGGESLMRALSVADRAEALKSL